MRSLGELLRLIRYAQARTSVAYHRHALERARTGLALAYRAHDEALADLRAHDGEHSVPPPPPAYLINRKRRSK